MELPEDLIRRLHRREPIMLLHWLLGLEGVAHHKLDKRWNIPEPMSAHNSPFDGFADRPVLRSACLAASYRDVHLPASRAAPVRQGACSLSAFRRCAPGDPGDDLLAEPV